MMRDKACDTVINDLVKQVEQHENTITQLVEIIGATNCRISELARKQKENDKTFLSTS